MTVQVVRATLEGVQPWVLSGLHVSMSISAIAPGAARAERSLLLAISGCMLLAALILSAVAPSLAPAADTGHITGTVTKADGGGALGDVNVAAFSDDWVQVAYDRTDPITGDYDIDGLPTGHYRVYFRDDFGDYVPEYYDDQVTFGAGQYVHVNAPDVTSGIDAELALAGRITGRVTDADGGGLSDIFVEAIGTADDWTWRWRAPHDDRARWHV